MTLLSIRGVNGMLFPAEPVDLQSLIPPPPPAKTRRGRAGTREVHNIFLSILSQKNFHYLFQLHVPAGLSDLRNEGPSGNDPSETVCRSGVGRGKQCTSKSAAVQLDPGGHM